MKGNNSQMWHRCGTCGTIFADLEELQSHLVKHTGSKGRASRPDRPYRVNSTDSPVRERGREIEGTNVRRLDR